MVGAFDHGVDMTLGAVDLLFNVVVALFWLRAWDVNRRLALFNPYLAGVENFTQPLFDFLRPAVGGLSDRMTAWFCLAMLIIFRGVALPMTNPGNIREIWQVRLGFEVLAPAAQSAWPPVSFLIFSLLSFAVFIFYVCGFALLFSRRRAGERPAEFLTALAGPFSRLSLRGRLLALPLYGLGLILILNLAAENVYGAPDTGLRPLLWLLRGGVATLAGVVDLLAVLQTVMIVLIIASWMALFTGGGTLAIISREWLDLLLGPFRRFPIRVGMLDLTPLVAFFVLGTAHQLLNGFLLRMIYIGIRRAGG